MSEWLTAFWARLRELVSALRGGRVPRLDADDPKAGVPIELETTRSADGSVSATTIVPTTRWEGLDDAFGTGRERWRNLLTAGVAMAALVVAVSVIWSWGDAEPEAEPQAQAQRMASPALSGLSPRLGLDDAAPPVRLEPAPPKPAASFVRARVTEEDLAPAEVAYPDPVGAPEPAGEKPAPAPAEVAEVAPAPAPVKNDPAPAVEIAAAEPVEAVKPEPVADPERYEVDAEMLERLAKRARCRKGSLPTRVLPGDTVQTIAWRHAGEDARALVPHILKANPRLKPERMKVGDLVCVPGVERVIVDYGTATYKIRKGDTISGIAERHEHLSRANIRALTHRARKRDMLFAGQEISLPVPHYASL